ncbi:hypothetical protein ABW21_db0200822 [Orbilia brochopaga]|nr:hypothetical protein ABW21_db0200822 [Drechslerella brochopaga]
MITFKIGSSEAQVFYVHQGAIESTSEVLRRQIASPMKEGRTRVIVLDDEDIDQPAAFNCFAQYIYTRDYSPVSERDCQQGDLVLHASVYIFAEKIEALELKALALRKATVLCLRAAITIDRSNFFSDVSLVVPLIYKHTYDINTGKPPKKRLRASQDWLLASDDSDSSSPTTVTRDGFRMLLAKVSAVYASELQQRDDFMAVLKDCSEFGTDTFMFADTGKKLSVTKRGDLKL